MPAEPLLFDKVTYIQQKDRGRRWLMQTPVSHLLLWDGEFQEQPGMLRLTPEVWLLLTPDQIYNEEPIEWPTAGGPIASIILRGTRVDPVLR